MRLSDGKPHRHRESTLSASEVMTIVILFQTSGFRNFKAYYTQHVCAHPRREFPNLVSYQRMVELQSEIVLPLTAFLHLRFGPCTGIFFIDSTPIKVCHKLRIKSNKVFWELAKAASIFSRSTKSKELRQRATGRRDAGDRKRTVIREKKGVSNQEQSGVSRAALSNGIYPS
jgi:hypothetical protein